MSNQFLIDSCLVVLDVVTVERWNEDALHDVQRNGADTTVRPLHDR